MSRKEDDQNEDPTLMDDLETKATGRLIEEGINEVIDYNEKVAKRGYGNMLRRRRS